MQHHIVRGDATLGDHPGGPGGQCVADDAGQGRGYGAGDREAGRRVRGRDHGPAGVEQHVGVAQRRDDPPRGAGYHRGGARVRAAGQHRGHVQFDVCGAAALPERGHLPAGLPDMGADHNQPVSARPGPRSFAASPDLRSAQGRLGPQAAQGPDERRPGAEQERLPVMLGVQHGPGDRLQVGVLGGVDHHPCPLGRTGQHLAHPGLPASRISARLMLRTSSGPIVPPLFSATKTRRSEALYPNAASFANSVAPTGISPAAVRAQWISAAVTRPASRNAGTSRTPS